MREKSHIPIQNCKANNHFFTIAVCANQGTAIDRILILGKHYQPADGINTLLWNIMNHRHPQT